MLKLHDLQVGDRFTFSDKYRGKVFEVVEKKNVRTPKGRETYIVYHDVIHKNQVISHKESKTFCMEVELVTGNRVVELTQREQELLQHLLHQHYTYMCTMGYTESEKGEVDRLFCKLTGLPGRRVVLSDDVNPPL